MRTKTNITENKMVSEKFKVNPNEDILRKVKGIKTEKMESI